MSDTPAVSMQRLAEAHGVKLAKRGRFFLGRCPFHTDAKRQKLAIDPTANTWTCPTCMPTSGSVIEFVMAADAVSRHHAIEILRDGAIGGKKTGRKVNTVRSMSAPFSSTDSDDDILKKLVGYYNSTLTTSPDALKYLQARGLRHPALIETFKLGYANRTLGLRLPFGNRRAGAEVRARLQRLGVLRPSGHERFNGCVVVPFFDERGNVVQVYGRKIGERLRAGTELHLWLHGDRRGLFNLVGLGGADTIIVTQSILDTLALWCLGLTNVTALHGLDGPTEDLIAVVRQLKPKRITFAFRRSKASEAAIEKLASKIATNGVEVFRGLLPMGMDVCDLVVGPDAAEKIAHVIRSAEWVAGTRPAAASPKKTTTKNENVETTKPHEMVFAFEDRRWRVRGLTDNRAPGTMRVNVFVAREQVGFHVDVFDLYSARHRTAFVREAGQELGLDEEIIKKDLGHLLLALEQAQDELLADLIEPKHTPVEMSSEDREQARAVLQDPKMLDRVLAAFENVGVIAEKTNLLVGYLVTISRMLTKPLALVIQSSSAAGKSSLMEAILSFVPEEDRISFSAMTGQSLFYMRSSAVKHKVLSIAEEEGARQASYSLKLLQSEGVLTIASTGKDTNGRLVAQEYRVEGPVALMLTTTAIDLDDELLNRCIVLTVDESPEQTQRIHQAQRKAQTLDGILVDAKHHEVLTLHRNAQRLLRPVKIANPLAMEMTYADLRVRARRDHQKLLTLIEAIALVHQHQRTTKQIELDGAVIEFIEADAEDVKLAEKLFAEVGGAGVDDLPPQTRKLLDMLDGFVHGKSNGESKFTRRQIRQALGLGDATLKVHLRRLVDAEFVVAHNDHGNGVTYSLAVNGVGLGRGSDGPRMGVGWPSDGAKKTHETSVEKGDRASDDAPEPREQETPRKRKHVVRLPRRGTP